MVFRQLLQKFGAWTTVLKWNEPWNYRVRLKRDLLLRLAIAVGGGAIATTVLLVLFAINVKPPHPLFAFIGMAVVGGLVWMNLTRGQSTAGGSVRICQEGVCRKRMYAGLSSQWAEEWSWKYSQIAQCAIIPAQSLDQSFSVMLLTDGATMELFGVPAKVDLNGLAQFLQSKGITVRHDVPLPPQFARPINRKFSLASGAIGFVVLLAGIGFYAQKVTFGRGREVADKKMAERPEQQLPPGIIVTNDPNLAPANNPADSAPAAVPAEAPPIGNPPESPAPPLASRLPENPAIPPNATPAPESSATVETNPSPTTTNPPNPEPTTATPAVPQAIPQSTTPPSTTPQAAAPGSGNRTDQIGGPGGFPFETKIADGEATVGFRFRMGSWAGKSAVAALDPVSQRNPPGRAENLIVAREGYVVGGIQVDAEDLVEAVRIIFVRQNTDGSMDKNEFYFGDWIGTPTGRPVKTLGKGIIPVLGTFGRRGVVIDAIGLILADAPTP